MSEMTDDELEKALGALVRRKVVQLLEQEEAKMRLLEGLIEERLDKDDAAKATKH